jgi:putative hydrolase of the HAD superfamily
MTKPIAQALVFDLGKVIVDFSVEKACSQVADVAGVKPADVKSWLFDDGLEYRFEAGEFSFPDLHKKFETHFKRSVPSDHLKLAAANIFSPIQSTIDILQQLRDTYAANLPFVLLSNTNEIHWEYIEQTWSISRFFDHLVLSFEVKALKPEQKIYEHVLAKIGCEPGGIFFVDDVKQNIDGAKALGLDAVLYEGEHKLRQDLRERQVRI